MDMPKRILNRCGEPLNCYVGIGLLLLECGIRMEHLAFTIRPGDDSTMVEFLPAMIEWNVKRIGHAFKVPVVSASDEAALPLEDGRWLKLALVGPKIPGQSGHERVTWSGVDFSYGCSGKEPQAILQSSSVALVTADVCLHLGIPEGSHVYAVAEERQTVRCSRLYSLVVNRRGDRYAEVLTVHDLGSESSFSKQECSIAVIGEESLESVDRVRMLGV
jgi:hypothetical protein